MSLLRRQGLADRHVAREIRERRPSREELEALVDATCKGFLPDDQRKLLIEGLRALVRFAE